MAKIGCPVHRLATSGALPAAPAALKLSWAAAWSPCMISSIVTPALAFSKRLNACEMYHWSWGSSFSVGPM